MEFVGLAPGPASELASHLAAAARELEAHARTVESLLNQAGIVSCHAGAQIREVAAWADYRARDLRRRIERIVAADRASGGSGPVDGFRFATRALARKAGRETAKDMKKVLDDSNHVGLDFEISQLRQYGNDPDFAGGFFIGLGADRTRDLLKLVKRTDDEPVVARALALAAAGKKLDPRFLDNVRHGHHHDDSGKEVHDVLCTVVSAISWVPPTTAKDAAATAAARIAMHGASKAVTWPVSFIATPFAMACLLADSASPPGAGIMGTGDSGAPGGFGPDPGDPIRGSADQSTQGAVDGPPMEPLPTTTEPPTTTSTTRPTVTTPESTDGASPP
jgi:hypothetical protein